MTKKYDVIIAGCGAAGLYAALNLPEELNVLIICKRELSLCNSSLAQGGIAGVYNSPDDNIRFHRNDTLIAGGFKNDTEAVDILVSEAAQDISRLIELGVDFDKNEDGSYHRTLEGGHSHHRIFHHADSTGREITEKLLAKVQTLKNVTIMENTILCGVKKISGGFSSFMRLADGSYITCCSRYMILATGGIGRVYKFTTNSAAATGDGIAFAYEMGAKIKHLDWVQFHPTAFNNKSTRECFLISEAVRGEGAYLLNCKKERFMHKYDSRLELAPRDVVSHAIVQEAKEQGSSDFYLDISYKDSDFLKKRFPMIYRNLMEQGFDLTKEPVPVYPCQHYLMGGINVDKNSETSIPGLYACGECSHTGVHGSNRLASNSLLEALVFSRRAAAHIASMEYSSPDDLTAAEFDPHIGSPVIPAGIRTATRNIMQESHFVIPDKEAAARGLVKVTELYNMLAEGDFLVDTDYVIARSIVTVAKIILEEVTK